MAQVCVNQQYCFTTYDQSQWKFSCFEFSRNWKLVQYYSDLEYYQPRKHVQQDSHWYNCGCTHPESCIDVATTLTTEEQNETELIIALNISDNSTSRYLMWMSTCKLSQGKFLLVLCHPFVGYGFQNYYLN